MAEEKKKGKSNESKKNEPEMIDLDNEVAECTRADGIAVLPDLFGEELAALRSQFTQIFDDNGYSSQQAGERKKERKKERKSTAISCF
ncbi:MAG: hypothetical protein HRT89_18250 [Lentisphaeria bacterium]|nr:hypothetical protein [Lentisphaeria bacterium]NQZ70000.1 hypothetical protein [Lentisphaeria bacterium]